MATKKAGICGIRTERQAEVVSLVAAHTALARRHVQRLGGFGSVTRANACLHYLCDELGLLERLYSTFSGNGIASRSDAIYAPTLAAAELIAERLGWPLERARAACRQTPTFGLLRHTTSLADAAVAFMDDPAVALGEWRLRWLPERLARDTYEIAREGSDRWQRVDFKPDAYFELVPADGEPVCCMLEADMGSMGLGGDGIEGKFALFRLYAQTRFAERYGRRRFCVLFVTTGEEREDSILSAAARAGFTGASTTTWRYLLATPPASSPIWKSAAGGTRHPLLPKGALTLSTPKNGESS